MKHMELRGWLGAFLEELHRGVECEVRVSRPFCRHPNLKDKKLNIAICNSCKYCFCTLKVAVRQCQALSMVQCVL